MAADEHFPTSTSEAVNFLGRGMAWPMQVDHTGAIRMSGGADNVEQSMRIILSTAPGERVFRPEFGCRIHDLLFEPINPRTVGLMAQAVRDAIGQWQPQVVVDDVAITIDPNRQGAVYIAISYSVSGSNDTRNLVYPFYVIPREGEE